MSKDLNKVMLIGRLGADPEGKFTASGMAVTNFRLAVGRSWKDADGQRQEETEWVPIVVWGKLAEICNEYLSKGSKIHIEGRLQTRSWEDKETGETRYKTEVVASDMIMLDSASSSTEGQAQPRQRPPAQGQRQAVQRNQTRRGPQQPPAKARNRGTDPHPPEYDYPEEDDLPF